MTKNTVLSLQGTLTKRTRLTLQPNLAKEPFRPSRSNDVLRDRATMIDRLIENKNRQRLKCGIKHWWLGDCASILPSIKFDATGQESSPQSPTILYRHALANMAIIL